MRKCELCKRNFKGMIHIAFIPLQEVLGFPHVLGINLLLCLECDCSYQAQYFNHSLKDIDDYLDWILGVSRKEKKA